MPISTPLIPILILILASSASGALLIMLLIALHNATHFPRLTPVPVTTDIQTCRYPPVSILIPARNEAHNIGRTVQALLAQGYPEFELLVLDDHSTDTTVQVAAAVMLKLVEREAVIKAEEEDAEDSSAGSPSNL